MVDVQMPPLGESVSEARISRWLKRPGDRVEIDEPLLDVETDKVETELPSPAAGYLISILVPDGESVDIGTVIAVLGESVDASVTTPTAPTPAAEAPPPVMAATPPHAAAPKLATASRATEKTTVRSPLVRRLVAEHQLDPSTIDGSGSNGRITRRDVERHLAAAASDARVAAPSPVRQLPETGEGEWVRFTPIRRRTAERMALAHATIPQVTTSMRVNYTRVQQARRASGATFKEQRGFSLTFLPFVARATADALRNYPYLNARVEGDGLRVLPRIDLGVAVDLDLQGLVVPVVRGAHDLRLPALAERINTLARGARERDLGVDDLTGSTFSITNPGAVGTLVTTPIVNPPEVAILSVEGIAREPVVMTTSDGVEAFAVAWMGQLALSYDHRAVDGAYAAAFLAEVRRTLETRDWSAEL